MCPQSAENVVKSEGGVAPSPVAAASGGGAWRSTRHGVASTSKRPFEANGGGGATGDLPWPTAMITTTGSGGATTTNTAEQQHEPSDYITEMLQPQRRTTRRNGFSARRSTARYRRATLDAGGAASGGDDHLFALGGSYDTPIDLLSPDASTTSSIAMNTRRRRREAMAAAAAAVGGASTTTSSEVITLGANGDDDDDDEVRILAASRSPPAASATAASPAESYLLMEQRCREFHQRQEHSGDEPSRKRLCTSAAEASSLEAHQAPQQQQQQQQQLHHHSGVMGRPVGRTWPRLRDAEPWVAASGVVDPVASSSSATGGAASGGGGGAPNRQVSNDFRYARRFHNAFSQAANPMADEYLARNLQEVENRRMFRMPSRGAGGDAGAAAAAAGRASMIATMPGIPIPPPGVIPPARWQMLYTTRGLDRSHVQQSNAAAAAAAASVAAAAARNHHQLRVHQYAHPQPMQIPQGPSAAGHSRGMIQMFADMRRHNQIEERMNAIGALIHGGGGQIPLAMHLSYVDRDFNENDYEMLLALDENVKQIGAPQSRIDELPVVEVKEVKESDEPCSICLEKPEMGENLRPLPCNHSFHQKCIDTWLQRRANCPVCKAEV